MIGICCFVYKCSKIGKCQVVSHVHFRFVRRDPFLQVPKTIHVIHIINISGARGPPQFWKKRSENLGWNFGVQPIPRVAPRIRFSHKLGRESHSESCSENALEFRELLREWPFHSESVFFKIGVVRRFLNISICWAIYWRKELTWLVFAVFQIFL